MSPGRDTHVRDARYRAGIVKELEAQEPGLKRQREADDARKLAEYDPLEEEAWRDANHPPFRIRGTNRRKAIIDLVRQVKNRGTNQERKKELVLEMLNPLFEPKGVQATVEGLVEFVAGARARTLFLLNEAFTRAVHYLTEA